jgi:hypothetical protein
MVAGLTRGEELELALAENRRYRAAIDIAVRGLAAARDSGFQEASGIIARVNEALARASAAHPPAPLWPQVLAWARRLHNRRTRNSGGR